MLRLSIVVLRFSLVVLVFAMDAAILAFIGLAFGFLYSGKLVFLISLSLLVISCLFVTVAYKKYLIEKEHLQAA